MKIYVLMKNDFPAAVYGSEKAAKEAVTLQEELSRPAKLRDRMTSRIHWQVHEFKLNKDPSVCL